MEFGKYIDVNKTMTHLSEYCDIISDITNSEVLWDGYQGSYDGDVMYILRRGSEYAIGSNGYGSCSYCDVLQACENNEDEIKNLAIKLAKNLRWFDSFEEMKDYIYNVEPGTNYYTPEIFKNAIVFLEKKSIWENALLSEDDSARLEAFKEIESLNLVRDLKITQRLPYTAESFSVEKEEFLKSKLILDVSNLTWDKLICDLDWVKEIQFTGRVNNESLKIHIRDMKNISRIVCSQEIFEVLELELNNPNIVEIFQ